MIPPQAPSLRRKAVYKAVYKVRPVADAQLRIKTPGVLRRRRLRPRAGTARL